MALDIDALARRVSCYDGPPFNIMEVCGTHTQAIFRHGVRAILPPGVKLLSGPGCPVCVTPAGYIDRAFSFSLEPDTVVCAFGDMLRVPGSRGTLLDAKAAGGDVRMLYAPMAALDWAKTEPDKRFILTAVGFETTLPIYALLVKRLQEERVSNLKLFLCAKALLPALDWICANNPDIGGFIGPGHVSAIIGSGVYRSLVARTGIPLAVAGFTYEHIVAALYDLLEQKKRGTAYVHNLYPSAVAEGGNAEALALIDTYFSRETSAWRGLGEIEASGYVLRGEFSEYDAGGFDASLDPSSRTGCLCGKVIMGRAEPAGCPHFGRGCSPAHPLGPCMVTSEGACGIWYANRA